jgi:hypothetical protein
VIRVVRTKDRAFSATLDRGGLGPADLGDDGRQRDVEITHDGVIGASGSRLMARM